MTNDRELMQQALEALKSCVSDWDWNGDGDEYMVDRFDEDKVEKAAAALRERLTQPEQEPPCKTGSQCVGGKCQRCEVQEEEPVAWMYPSDYETCLVSEHVAEVTSIECTNLSTGEKTTIPLYTQPQRCPNCESLEAQNAELDARLAEMEKGVKPWQTEETYDKDGFLIARRMKRGPNCEWEPWLTPPRREWVGLTEEEKRQLFEREDYEGWLDYINAIEAKLRKKNMGDTKDSK